MKALKGAWFEFKGRRSDEMGVLMVARPQRGQSAANGSSLWVSGRSGRLWLDDGTFDNCSVQVTCVVPDGSMDGVLNWLRGDGRLRFSDEANRSYKARVSAGFVRTAPFPRLSAQRFTVQFDCQPFRYAYPSPEKIVLTDSGTVNNPGTAASAPKIRIEGKGDITVVIGDCLMAFEGLTDGVTVDSELMECLNVAETQLLNAKAQMESFPMLQPGANAVSWYGDVERISIWPRWRYV